MSRRRMLAPLGVAVLALFGCGGQSEVTQGDFTIFVHGDSVLARGGDDALIEGALRSRDGCVLLEQEGADVEMPVVWPSGTRISNDDPLTLELPSGALVEVGQTVSGAGGVHDASSDQVGVTVDDQCLSDTKEVLVFNADADLAVP